MTRAADLRLVTPHLALLVRAVLAHTLAERNASVRVLERAGFAPDGERIDGDVGAVWRWRLERPPGTT